VTVRIGRFEVKPLRAVRTALASLILVPSAALIQTHQSARSWASATRRALALSEDVKGVEKVQSHEQYLVAPLHEGFVDVLLLAHLPLDMRFVVRDELFDWTWLGRALHRTDQIRVNPEGGVEDFRQLLKDADDTFDRGQSLVIFPQGSILGIEAAFRRGPFRIADRLGVRVLPVVISGTHRVWEHPYSDRLRFGQHVSMRVLDPLPIGGAVAGMVDLERSMKQIALSADMAPARHFEPERDGYWDGYSYAIDPAYPELARQVAQHRSAVSGETQVDTPVDGVGPT